MQKKKDKLKPFKQHGVVFRGANASQAYGDCPFTGKENKFYVNKKSLLWDSKTAGVGGNLFKFLEKISEQNVEDMTTNHLKKLAVNRGLPEEAFKDMELGLGVRGYTFPCRDEEGKLKDLRMYRLGKRIMGTASCPVYMYGVEDLVNTPMTHPVFLCEGEWDTIAMKWLIKRLKLSAVAVGVPGAGTFKREWTNYFKNRDVIVCYDNDEAGEEGELLVRSRIGGFANSVIYLHWPPSLPTGYDLRDLIAQKAVKDKKPKGTNKFIESCLRKHPRKDNDKDRTLSPGEPEKASIKTKRNKVTKRTFEDVCKVYNKWMKMNDYDAVKVATAVVLSTYMPGDPCWLMLTAPSGGAKTEILSSFGLCSNVYLTSSLTPKALVSGASDKDGVDPSMLPKLDQKTLIIKDFTVILGKKEADKEEIFSIFRDAYDGSTGKDFGSGLSRRYNIHFSMLAGVTPIIYNSSLVQAGLGERYLKYFMGDSIDHPDEIEVMMRAINNVSKENEMRKELQTVVYEYVDYMSRKIRTPGFVYPTIPDWMVKGLLHAVRYAASLRGTVTRDARNNDIITSKPYREVGTRFAKNLAKLLIHLAVVDGRSEVNEDDYRIIRKILLDTVDQRSEEIVRRLYIATPTIDDSITTRQVAHITKYNSQTVVRLMNDFNLLGIVRRVGKNNRYEWTVSERIREMLEISKLYSTESERKRERGDAHIFEVRQKARKKIKVRIKKRN